ncbi:MAG: PhzF family phenazine biosynthesis protein, partial [Gammaproteobacteria bacterium]
MPDQTQLYRLSAFAEQPDGGNPAGVWIGDKPPPVSEMQKIAAEVGYSETAFVTPREGKNRDVRYFSPLAEVPFCGHATIATGVALGRTAGAGLYHLNTAAGDVALDVKATSTGFDATLTSVATKHKPVDKNVLAEALSLIGWDASDLNDAIPPAIAYAGAWHLVLAANTLQRLQNLDYDFEALKALMLEHDLTTLQLIWQDTPTKFHSRNPFPVGGVVEDPATGAAAAALGGYLRDAKLIKTPLDFEIRQG